MCSPSDRALIKECMTYGNDSMNSGSQRGQASGRGEAVSIYFADPTINHLFSELLKARGVRTRIIEDAATLPGSTRIITEPQFFPQIPNALRPTCLVVGNKDAMKGLEVLQLSRPLTEEKIETALATFLSRA